jgi:hypothetical protein
MPILGRGSARDAEMYVERVRSVFRIRFNIQCGMIYEITGRSLAIQEPVARNEYRIDRSR